ncbi:hypothetical protein C500_06231 [Natrialba magadii ATCC 43099]|uniref:Uncharacterized protein n=1 Tax=Natrialba magadii (strain ATCC 43099 / DSM 3394 / CCM 3739 / CIP 104546 / IAM 13178 / JCM 8861 / NBRC 102185 / NCIMB 2190 / MS3) TaxID=547559 RepID=L9V535_NATMM|nr:hypothetical protein C500_06231 [Natrialba magadii ATCC 43099]
MAILLTAGCVGSDDEGLDDEPDDDDKPEEDDGNDGGGWIFLHAEVVDEADVYSGYSVLDADEEYIAGRGLYPSLFEAVERIEADDPIGRSAQSDHTGRASDEGQETLETARNARSESGSNGQHRNDGARSREATHYVEYDGWTLRVWVDDGGVDE